MKPGQHNRIDSPRAAYEYLFGESIDVSGSTDLQALSITGLARAVTLSGGRSKELKLDMSQVPVLVNTVLTMEQIALGIDEEPETYTAAIGSVVSNIFSAWEVARVRQGAPGLLDTEPAEKFLLIAETAKAVIRIDNGEPPFDITKNKGDAEHLTALLTRYSPTFVESWFDGRAVRKWIEQTGGTREDYSQWLTLLNPSIMKRFLMQNTGNPVAALTALKETMETTLSDEAVASVFGVELEDAKDAVPMSTRLHMALHTRRSDVNDTLITFKTNIDQIEVSKAKLGTVIGFDEKTIDKVMPRYMVKYFAQHYPTRAVEACSEWLVGTRSATKRFDYERDRRIAKIRSKRKDEAA